ncbi:MAG: hypothetical protein U9Q69_04155 [Nanoarchaeota archaeon]|nr:hypothetical protein [Nanoarchaeota archaeon]
MIEAINKEDIMSELHLIKEDLDYIKEHMVDLDFILTAKEEDRLEKSLKEFKEGKTIDLESFEKKIGL